MRASSILLGTVFQAVFSASGLAWGWTLTSYYPSHPPRWLRGLTFGRAGIAAALLLLTSTVIASPLGRRSTRPARVSWAMLAYVGFLMVGDPFCLTNYDASAACIGLLLLVPAVFSVGYLARTGSWAGAFGAGLFLAASIAMIIRNGQIVDTGAGFLSSWAR